ncbi:hypothetical protein [Profundibacterium mesophilum]|uniref:Uncharacterized protein n=1 Tax=Profundibacterium mesophilum KAUST100406-0324 TaxID=1037889 RepID=A0A921NZL4_9RHOB|nr:hypothetical protein [Profundibacterium mesophilum]KAF0677559.1 hypothetical protein PMES_00064 [Profundibacterium mesophilum KAUST100406-0324]
MDEIFDVLVVGQEGRIGYEAAVFAASLRRSDPDFAGRLIVAEPQPGPLWHSDPRIADPALRALLGDLGAQIVPFASRHFGSEYPYGNKIEALRVMDPGRPFVFFDSDTLITAPLGAVPFDFDRPSASLRRENTWPRIELYGPSLADIWGALYRQFDLDFAASLDPGHPEHFWKRYSYFNAGFYYHRSAPRFGALFERYARTIRDAPPPELVLQELDPWLDQIALPLVIHALGGGLDALPPGHLDGAASCHYRSFPLLYARESDATVELLETVLAPNPIKKVLKAYEPLRKIVYQGKGRILRDLFDRDALPRREAAIRNRIKREKLWLR